MKPTRQQLLDASTQLIKLAKLKEQQSRIQEIPLGWLCVEEMAKYNKCDSSSIRKIMQKSGNEYRSFTVAGPDGKLKKVRYYKIV